MAGNDARAVSTELRRVAAAALGEAALAEAAGRLAVAVRQNLSTEPGGEHRFPWRRSGVLAGSIGVTCEGGEAVVGSTDPAAVYQELGTAMIPPRPFLGTAAAREGRELVARMGEEVAESLRRMLR